MQKKRTGNINAVSVGVAVLRTRQRPNTKKAGRIPIRTSVGPTKNLLLRRSEKRPAKREDTIFPCWQFILRSKKQIMKLGRFTDVFC